MTASAFQRCCLPLWINTWHATQRKVKKWHKVTQIYGILCHISAIFEDIDLKFCTDIHQLRAYCHLTYSTFFFNFWFWGGNFGKEKNVETNWKLLAIFKISKIRDSSFVALLILSHSYKTIDQSFKTAPAVVIPVNPYFWSKSAENDVTISSFGAELWYPRL